MNQNRNKLLGNCGSLVATIAVHWLILFTLLVPNVSHAQSWKAGRASLMKNDFKSAKVQLSSALKAAKSKTELAETYKYLGVAQFMSGDRNSATSSFQMAKNSNPGVKLTASEVIDESVIPVFNGVKPGKVAATAPQRAATPSSEAAGKPAIAKQKSKRTLLKVISNVPSAQVSLDGIAYGTAGQEIEVQPGIVILELSAPGFRSKAIKVQLEALTSSSVTVNLEKIPVKPKPQPIPKSIPLPQASVQPNAQVGAKGKQVAGRGPSKGKKDLFGEDPLAGDPYMGMQQPSAGGAPVGGAPNVPYVTPPPAPSQPVAPPQVYGQAPGGGMPAQPQYQGMPQAPYPAAPQPGYAPAQPYAAYPPQSPYPVYPQYAPPQPYAMPYYPPTPYGGYMAPPNPYAYAPPAPNPYAAAPVQDPYGGYLGPPPEAPASALPPVLDGPAPSGGGDGGGMPPPPILPTTSGPSKKTAATKADKCGGIKFMPFGAGQFCNGSTLKGVVFLGAEVASLYFYKTNTDAAAGVQTKLNSILAERGAARGEVPEADQPDFDTETESKRTAAKAAINKARQNAQYSMVSFFGLWAAGVVDASINVPTKGKPTKKSKKRSKIQYSYDLDLDTAPLGTWALAMPSDGMSDRDELLAEYRLGYTPILDKQRDQLLHSVTFGLSWEL